MGAAHDLEVVKLESKHPAGVLLVGWGKTDKCSNIHSNITIRIQVYTCTCPVTESCRVLTISVLEQRDSAGDLGSKAAWKSHTLMALRGGMGERERERERE